MLEVCVEYGPSLSMDQQLRGIHEPEVLHPNPNLRLADNAARHNRRGVGNL